MRPPIASAEDLSVEYTAKLMRRLRIGGIVTSIRGTNGGYRMAKPASRISVWEVLQILDENFLSEAGCECAPRERSDCRKTTRCAIQSLWRRLGDELRATLEQVTLAELCIGEPEPDVVSLPIHRPASALNPLNPLDS